MMYLCEKIVTDEGEYPMCGVLPYSITARTADRNTRDFDLDTALAKRYVPSMAAEVASSALQVFGGIGYTDQTRVSRIWRDCRGNQIAWGTDEVMAGVVAKSIVRKAGERRW